LPTIDPGDTARQDLFAASARISADAAGVDTMHGLLESVWEAMRLAPFLSLPPTTWRNEFATAMGEIGSNIIRHSLSLQSEALTACQLEIVLRGTSLVATFRNPGAPFTGEIDQSLPMANEDDPFNLPEGHFGLALARRSLDDLRYEHLANGQNVWTLVKNLPHQRPGAGI
jgi:anti-sigma regulatory factor (Ser/Thr protein kinase)